MAGLIALVVSASVSRSEFMRRRAKGDSSAKVYCLTLNQPELAPQLQKVAADTKGNYLDVSLDTLRAAAAE